MARTNDDHSFIYIDINKISADYGKKSPEKLGEVWIKLSREFWDATASWMLESTNWCPPPERPRDALYQAFKDVVVAHLRGLIQRVTELSFADACTVSKPLD